MLQITQKTTLKVLTLSDRIKIQNRSQTFEEVLLRALYTLLNMPSVMCVQKFKLLTSSI